MTLHPSVKNCDRIIAIMVAIVFWLLMAVVVAQAQDVVMPTVPTVGVSPVLQWLMGILTVVISVCLPVAVAFAKQRWNIQNDQARAGMINTSIVRAAHLADADMTQKNLTINDVGPNSPIMEKAVAYVSASHPDAISATPQATEAHLAQAVKAEINRIQAAKAENPLPSVVVSPVSALR